MKRLSLIVAAIALLAGVQQASAAYVSAGNGLNLRSQGGTNYPVITTIPYCAQVQIYGQNYGWCNVQWNNYTGYASCKYLVDYNPCGGGGYNYRPSYRPSYGGGGGYGY